MRLVQHIVSISIHTPLAGSDGTARPWSRPCGNFNPHSPCGERQYAYRHPSVKVEISIHTPLAGSDSLLCGRYQYNKFQSTLPLRGATQIITIYTSQEKISIHTPLAGSDPSQSPASGYDRISIHTPLAGSDSPSASTAPIRQYFNPHSPCGERLRVCCAQSECRSISIHTPLAGSDRTMTPIRPLARLFQSTLPLRGATDERLAAYWLTYISIHTPLAGSDAMPELFVRDRLRISIHTPLAGSDAMPELFVRDRLRISIHTPLAGSDTGAVESIEIQGISIHTPLAGSDVQSNPSTNFPFYFNPHSPCGERRFHRAMRGETEIFQSTLPLRGATITLCRRRNAHLFQSTLPLRGATSQPLR